MNLLCYLFFITIETTDYDSITERDSLNYNGPHR